MWKSRLPASRIGEAGVEVLLLISVCAAMVAPVRSISAISTMGPDKEEWEVQYFGRVQANIATEPEGSNGGLRVV